MAHNEHQVSQTTWTIEQSIASHDDRKNACPGAECPYMTMRHTMQLLGFGLYYAQVSHNTHHKDMQTVEATQHTA